MHELYTYGIHPYECGFINSTLLHYVYYKRIAKNTGKKEIKK